MAKYILATKQEACDGDDVFCVSPKEKVFSFEEAKQAVIESLEKTLKWMEEEESSYSLAIEKYDDFTADIIEVQTDHEYYNMLQSMYINGYQRGDSAAFCKNAKRTITTLEKLRSQYQSDIVEVKESIQCIKECDEEKFCSACYKPEYIHWNSCLPVRLEE